MPFLGTTGLVSAPVKDETLYHRSARKGTRKIASESGVRIEVTLQLHTARYASDGHTTQSEEAE